MSSQTIATSAQSYHCNLGWAVVPIQKNSKIPPKGFRLRRFFTNSPTESNVRSWFPSDYDGNLGVILGDVSDGLACRDFDDRDSYQRWAAAYPRLADRLPTETTPRGHHVYFTADEGEVRDISPSGRSIIRFDDGELRGGDGYCVLSPSAGYDWRIPPTSVPHVADLILAGFVPANGHQQGQQRNKNHRCVTQDVTQEYDLCDTDLLTFAETVQIAIDTSQPTRPGKRNQMVFELARALRSIPELHGAGQSILKPIVQRWYVQAHPRLETKDFASTWIDFDRGWRTVEKPKWSIVGDMVAGATGQGINRLESICQILQVRAGDGPFHLDCRTAGILLGVSYRTAARWLRQLRSAGILELVRAGDRGKRRASEYRYLDNKEVS